MFRGSSPLTLDAKGRMAIPAKFRERLRDYCAGRLVITVSRDPCLLIYPLPEWEKVEAKIESLSSMDSMVSNFKRLLIGRAEDCEMDKQGRVLIPPGLRDGLLPDRQVTLVGVVNKFELWDAARWTELNDSGAGEGLEGMELPSELRNLSF
ncbi:MAG: division/cell wall cluster transcriptional repressor MraZ [Gammaproteobacteria bacterium]